MIPRQCRSLGFELPQVVMVAPSQQAAVLLLLLTKLPLLLPLLAL